MLDAPVCRDLASVLAAHDYTVDAVVATIGEAAHRALARNSTVPAARALLDRDDPLAVLTRLWLLQQPVPRGPVEAALPDLVAPMVRAGLLAERADVVSALIDVRPYASDDGAAGWVASDLTPNLDTSITPIRPDFVLGVSSASSTLAQMTVRRPVPRALDLGAGCGVQSLHLARHCGEVVATDLNPRAVELARLTFALNGVDVDLRQGNLYAPVVGERFDLIVSNPPYVMSPPGAGGDRLIYREGSLEADRLVQRVVMGSAAHLADGGVSQVLGNWAHVRGEDWTDRLAGWIAPTGCDAHVIQREVLDVYEYAELWLADAGLAGAPDYLERYQVWLDYFDALQIEAVGMGWLLLSKAGRDQPDVTIEHWPYPLEQPIGPALGQRLGAVGTERGLDDATLLTRRWSLAGDVIEETRGVPGLSDPEHLVFRQQRGLCRATELDTATAGVLGACDGELSLDRIIASVAHLLGVDPAELAADMVPRLRPLIVDGFLVADSDPGPQRARSSP